MNDFPTRFAQAKTDEEFSSAVLDVIRGNPNGIDPILCLIGFASEMAMRAPKSQREQVVEFMRAQALAIAAGPQ